ncbi:MAG: hypothetical protein IJD87_02020 [Turicibacter sp.]|nr:hypothetical protein [Turicibacter sp.]
MKIKKLIPVCFIGGGFTILTLCIASGSPVLHLIDSSLISLNSNRMMTLPMSTQLQEESPVIANATSQLQLLNEQRSMIVTELQTLSQQYEELKVQHDILMNETTSYTDIISKNILMPLKKIKQQLNQYNNKDQTSNLTSSSLNAILKSIETIEQYLHNPNDSTYEETLQTAHTLINKELIHHNVDNVLNVTSELMQSGLRDTMIRMKLQDSKELLQAFETDYLRVDNEQTEQYKKSRQQQLATEDALDLKALQLDELALRLSGILDEIEQVTQ